MAVELAHTPGHAVDEGTGDREALYTAIENHDTARVTQLGGKEGEFSPLRALALSGTVSERR
ncbi:hypothetical protein ACFVZD_21120 [Streptomyces sp. NPDC058287]|uniref:hypothetical protein n=1 Tax=unclassified Streptomyces TaxID=2593676 RepID=UPI0036E8A4CB